MFDVDGKVIVVIGGYGVLGTAICQGLALAGAKIAILGLDIALASALAETLPTDSVGGVCDVTDIDTIQKAADQVLSHYGHIDALINAAGGNHPKATVTSDLSFFDLSQEAIHKVFDLNFHGSLYACQVFGKIFAAQKHGMILNISSMAAMQPLTRVVSYSAAKAAINNFTQWLAVHFASEYDPRIRVNAIAPGFFLTAQNRYLLTEESDGSLTARGKQILDHTPMRRFGEPDELIGVTIWLLSDAARFVTGVVIPIDGGFSAFSGV